MSARMLEVPGQALEAWSTPERARRKAKHATAHDGVLITDARRLGQLELPHVEPLVHDEGAGAVPKSGPFIVCPRFPTNTNSALLRGSSRIHSRTRPSRRFPSLGLVRHSSRRSACLT
jgi:hypothetical protein